MDLKNMLLFGAAGCVLSASYSQALLSTESSLSFLRFFTPTTV